MGEFENRGTQMIPHNVYFFGQEGPEQLYDGFEKILKGEEPEFELRSQEKEIITIKPGNVRNIQTNLLNFGTYRGDSLTIFLDKELRKANLQLEQQNRDMFVKGILSVRNIAKPLDGISAQGFVPIIIGEQNQILDGPGISGVCQIKPDTLLGRVYCRKGTVHKSFPC